MKRIFNEIKDDLPEFHRDFKYLRKRFCTLTEDLAVFIETELNLFHKLKIDNRGIELISNLGIEYPKIYKVKKFACKSLKGKGVQSGIRIIYAYYPDKDTIEFIEIYYKGDKEIEDRDRIQQNYKK